MYSLGAQGNEGTIMTGQLKYPVPPLISNFRSVVNVVFLLLGISPASEMYIPTFRNRTYDGRAGCSETSAYKTHRQGNHPKEIIQKYSVIICLH